LTPGPQSHSLAGVPYTVVCISSEDGAGARETAPIVASRLGFRLIDEDIVTRAAVEAGVETDLVADVERRKSLLVRLVEGLGTAGIGAGLGAGYALPSVVVAGVEQPASDELRGMIQSVIEDTAVRGNAVIVAHAASLALGERDDVLRVHVTASPHTRERRVASALGVDQKQAAQTLKRSDAGRADYIKRFYGLSELPTHYDLVINTDKLEPEAAVELIVQAVGTGGASQGTAA
jgi:cytidylate kinase